MSSYHSLSIIQSWSGIIGEEKYFGFVRNKTRVSTAVHYYAEFKVPSPEDNAFEITLFFLVKGHPVELYCTGLFNTVRREKQSCNNFSHHVVPNPLSERLKYPSVAQYYTQTTQQVRRL